MPAPKDPIKYKEWLLKKGSFKKGERLSETSFFRLMKNDPQKIPLRNFRVFIRRFDMKPKRIFSKETRTLMSIAKQGYIPWNKGKTEVYSKEILESMSKPKRGKPNPTKGIVRKPEYRIQAWFEKSDMRYSRKQQKRDHRQNFQKGIIPWNKGIEQWPDGLPKELTAKISLALKVRNQNPIWIERRINSRKSNGKDWISESQRILMRENRKNWVVPFKDTKPERMMQIALSLNGIKFEKHKLISNHKNFWHPVDIFIEPNICVEVDGDYWHNKPEKIKRDLIINHSLNLMGYFVIRIWESDIKKNTQNCAENIIKMIKERMELHP